MKAKYMATLIDAINVWLDAVNDEGEFILTVNTGDLMATAAASVFDAIQEADAEATAED